MAKGHSYIILVSELLMLYEMLIGQEKNPFVKEQLEKRYKFLSGLTIENLDVKLIVQELETAKNIQ